MSQLNQVRKMGSLGGIMKMMPGVTKEMRSAAANVDEGQLNKIEAIVNSMTNANAANRSSSTARVVRASPRVRAPVSARSINCSSSSAR